MGQFIRMMSYSQSNNVANQIRTPYLIINNAPLSFYTLDDGVMGGQSHTFLDQLVISSSSSTVTNNGNACMIDGDDDDNEPNQHHNNGKIRFTGEINTNGGGFTSIRSMLQNGIPKTSKGLKIRYKGDGKTYKILLSDGSKGVGGPFSSTPSWQCDLPTSPSITSSSSSAGSISSWSETCLYFDNFIPTFGARKALSEEERLKYNFVNEDMKQIGIMLSLKLSNGDANPIDTFGSGIFGFHLIIDDIELF
jgi:hypothetical protein